eukprot:g2313.t1
MVRRREDERWRALLASFFVGSVTGVQYAFGVYSDALKSEFNLKQHQVDTISSFYFIGGSLSFFMGFANDMYGPRVVTGFGGVVTTLSILSEWLIARNKLPFNIEVTESNVVGMLSAANFIWAIGNAAMTAPAFSTAIRNFPKKRGTVVGICKGAVGIIGGLLTMAWAGFFFVPDSNKHTIDYLLAVVLYVTMSACFGVFFIRVVPQKTENEATFDRLHERRIKFSYVNLFLLCIVVVVAAATESSDGATLRLMFAICIVVLVCSFFGVFAIRQGRVAGDTAEGNSPDGRSLVYVVDEDRGLVKSTCNASDDEGVCVKSRSSSNDVDDMEALLVGDSDVAANGVKTTTTATATTTTTTDDSYRLGDDIPLARVVRMRECWLLLLISMTLFGSGVMVTSNLAQMVTAHSFSGATKSMAVSFFSFSQAVSRMVAGAGADLLLKSPKKTISVDWYAARTWRLVEACLVMALGQILLLFCDSVKIVFLLGVSLCGLGFGSLHPLLVVCSSELFGLKYHSQNYTFFDGMGSAVSAVLMSQLLVQFEYEKHTVGDANDCYGNGCFEVAHVVATCTCVVSACAAAYMTLARALPLYRRVREKLDRRRKVHRAGHARGPTASNAVPFVASGRATSVSSVDGIRASGTGVFSTGAWVMTK